jgi:putative intracellular protease/amidase/YHS domain-containing protein
MRTLFCVGLLGAVLVQSACAQESARLALDGIDPIRFIAGQKIKGKPQISSVAGRFKYQFESEATKKTFDSDPSRYGIQLDGKCTMSTGMDGLMSLAQVKNGRIYVSGSEMCFAAFRDQPASYVNVETGERRASQPMTQQQDTRPVAAILVFPGVQIIDYTGPYEVFGQSGMRVVLVAEKKEPLVTAMGMQIVPHHTFEDCPKPTVLLLPGGRVRPDEYPQTIEWIKKTTTESQYTMSVCNGAFWLAKAGLLDGKKATTYYGMIDGLREAAPAANVVDNERYTDNGSILTTAGLSSGIDGALYLMSKLRGFGAAQATALNMEYDWKPDSKYARGSFADKALRTALGNLGFEFPEGAVQNWTVVRQDGNADWWQKNWTFDSALSPADLMKVVDNKLAGSWKRTGGSAANGHGESTWSFDADGKPWKAAVKLDSAGAGKYKLVIRLDPA